MLPVRTHLVGGAPWWRVVDWRLVAAVAFPLWAFIFGLLVPWRPAPAAPPTAPGEPQQVAYVPAPPDDAIPPPREVVVREAEPVVVPVVVPVPVAAEQPVAADPPEFRLPDNELLAPPDKCKTFGTKIRFHKGVGEAVEAAKAAKKLVFVLHISGHFDDPGFT